MRDDDVPAYDADDHDNEDRMDVTGDDVGDGGTLCLENDNRDYADGVFMTKHVGRHRGPLILKCHPVVSLMMKRWMK